LVLLESLQLVQILGLQFLIFEFDSKIVDNALNHTTELENISSWCGDYKLVFIRRQVNNYKVVHSFAGVLLSDASSHLVYDVPKLLETLFMIKYNEFISS
jgi:hypothetical protein